MEVFKLLWLYILWCAIGLVACFIGLAILLTIF